MINYNSRMDLNLTNKVYLVTGGAKGIGAAISKTIAEEKGIVVIAGRNEKDNQARVGYPLVDRETKRLTGGRQPIR